MTRPTLSRVHYLLITVIAVGAVAISAIGFAGSYSAVRALALSYGFGAFATFLPLGVDAGIGVLLALDLLLSWLRIPFPLLRHAAWLLTAATIYLNAKVAWPDPTGLVLHGVIPLLFVIIVEAARHAVARLAGIKAGQKEMEGLGIARWTLSPFRTFALWRRKHLWGIGSRDEALKVEQQRLVYRSYLRRTFGRGWRRAAPQDALVPLQLAALGVPLHLTYQAGLKAAGLPADAYEVLFAVLGRGGATELAGTVGPQPRAVEAAAPRDPDAERQLMVEALAQALAEHPMFAQIGAAGAAASAHAGHAQAPSAQAPRAQAPSAQDALAQPRLVASAQPELAQDQRAQPELVVIAQPPVTHTESAFAQVSGWPEGFEQEAGALARPVVGVEPEMGPGAQDPAAGDHLRMLFAQDASDSESLRMGLVQAAGAAFTAHPVEGGLAAGPESVPAARVSRLAAETGPVITQSTDLVRIPATWVEGFEAFVLENSRYPEQDELAQYLYSRGLKGKGTDGPVSLESVRRYYGKLQAMFPLEDQQQFDLAVRQ